LLKRVRDRNSFEAPRLSVAFIALMLVSLLGGLSSIADAQEVPELQVNSAAYIVIDADTGEIFAQKNAHDRRAMASLTKIFTAIEALQRAPLDLTITTHDGDVYDESSTRVGFGSGEEFSLVDLLYGMLLPSGNDAAHAIARDLGAEPGDTSDEESYERFIGWMNDRIQLMGLQDTHLVNAHGWGVPDHYSTAYDLATFMRYAILNPEFLEVIGTSSYTTANGYSFTNTNKILGTEPDLIGGKTGYDDDAGYCLIEVAQRNGRTMISVTLDGVAPDDWYDDNVVLLNYAFDQAEARGGVIEGEVASYTDPDLAAVSTPEPTPAMRSTANAAVVQVLPTSEPATNTIANQPSEPGQSQSSQSINHSAPGIGASMVIALAVVLAFAVLAGRGIWKAEVGFIAVTKPYLKRIRFPAIGDLIHRLQIETTATKSSKPPSKPD
jgi:D-alanyl-D-alanine carboxypeptidase (penicillin-binding protein 5/6)